MGAEVGGPSLAYIGPGAGFAAAGSLLVLLGTFALALGIILIWPFKAAIKVVYRRGKTKAKVKRVVVIGLDGFDPKMAAKYADRMPNFARLQAQGCHSALGTSIPAPAAARISARASVVLPAPRSPPSATTSPGRSSARSRAASASVAA